MTVPSLPPTSDSSAAPTVSPAEHVAAMARVDGCPECVLNVEAPYVAEVVDGEARCAYACTDCGHFWTTSWKVA